MQADGRSAQLSHQRATVTHLYSQKCLFSTASIIRGGDEKLAAFADMIAVEDARPYCARSLARFFCGEIAALYTTPSVATPAVRRTYTRLWPAYIYWDAVVRLEKVQIRRFRPRPLVTITKAAIGAQVARQRRPKSLAFGVSTGRMAIVFRILRTILSCF